MPTPAMVAVIVAAAIGIMALIATHGQEAQRFLQNSAGTTQQQVSNALSTAANITKQVVPSQANQTVSVKAHSNSTHVLSPVSSLVILNSTIYSHIPSHVTVKNNGTESVIVNQISFGQYKFVTGGIVLPAGKQQRFNITGIAADAGPYLLQVNGIGLATGSAVAANKVVNLLEPLTKLEIVNASVYIAKVQYPAISMVLRNAGMDSISITGIGLVNPISFDLWAHGKKSIVLLPNQTMAVNIQLDSYSYINSTVQQAPDGILTYFLPSTGSAVTIHFSGQSSTGHILSTSVQAPVKNDYKLVVQVATATIKIENAMIRMNAGTGQSTVTLTFRNNSTHPVVLRSVVISGANVPVSHWSIPANFVINIATTNTLTLTNPAGLDVTDIGSYKQISATGQFYSGSAIDNGASAGTVVYANAIVQVTTG